MIKNNSSYNPYRLTFRQKMLYYRLYAYERLRPYNLFNIKDSSVNVSYFINISLLLHLIAVILFIFPYDLFFANDSKQELKVKVHSISSKDFEANILKNSNIAKSKESLKVDEPLLQNEVLNQTIDSGVDKPEIIPSKTKEIDNVAKKKEVQKEAVLKKKVLEKKSKKSKKKINDVKPKEVVLPIDNNDYVTDVKTSLEEKAATPDVEVKESEGKVDNIQSNTNNSNNIENNIDDNWKDGIVDVDAGGGGIEDGDIEISPSTIIASFFRKCWMETDIAKKPNNDIIVHVNVFFDKKGRLINYDIENMSFASEIDRMYYNAMRFAIEGVMLKCNQVDNLPQESYSSWKEVPLTFKYSEVQ